MTRSHSFKEYVGFAEAWLFLAVARVMLILLPFRKLAPLLGSFRPELPNAPFSIDPVIAGFIRNSIIRACVRSPWRTKCFEQAIAARWMTGRRKLKSIIFLGLRKSDDGGAIQAHAWLKCGDTIIVGGDVSRYAVINWYGDK